MERLDPLDAAEMVDPVKALVPDYSNQCRLERHRQEGKGELCSRENRISSVIT